MISTALAALHARKWLVELILLTVLVAGVALFCRHLIEVGVQRERAVWVAAAAKARAQAELKLARETERANIAEKARDIELAQLDDYRRDHPLHGTLDSLRHRPHSSGVSAATAANSADAGTGARTGDVQPLPSGDIGGDEGEPDQLGMLDLLGAVGDRTSATLREWQAR